MASDRPGGRPTEADELYGLDPAAFVEARNALVRRLRAEKRKDDAAAVGALRRPTPTAWALNVVAREHADLVEQALDAGHRLRDATEAAVGGKADELRRAIADDQAASGAVVEAAVKHLGARGPGLTPSVRATVRAAVLSEDLADELRRGVLSTEHEAGGFEFGEAFTVAARPEASASSRTPSRRATPSASKTKAGGTRESDAAARRKARDEERAAAKARRAELQAKVKALREEAKALERTAVQQERAADQQQRAAHAARSAADQAARALEDAQRALDAT